MLKKQRSQYKTLIKYERKRMTKKQKGNILGLYYQLTQKLCKHGSYTRAPFGLIQISINRVIKILYHQSVAGKGFRCLETIPLIDKTATICQYSESIIRQFNIFQCVLFKNLCSIKLPMLKVTGEKENQTKNPNETFSKNFFGFSFRLPAIILTI